MNKFIPTFALLAALALNAIGCGKSPSAPEEPKLTAFETAAEEIRANMIWVESAAENPNPNGFFISKFELTRHQWLAIAPHNYVPWDQSALRWNAGNYHPDDYYTRNKPATNICWTDAQFLLNKLNEAAGDSLFRLPTQDEWKYAANFGKAEGDAWYFGSDVTKMEHHAFYRDNSDLQLHEVGLKNPNSLGMYDVYGNARELIQPESVEWIRVNENGTRRRAAKTIGGSFDSALGEINELVMVPFDHFDRYEGGLRNEELERTTIRLVMNSEVERSLRASFKGK